MPLFKDPQLQIASRSLLEWIDAVADRFEVEWNIGQSPVLEDYLEGTVGEKRLLLLHELAKIDLERRLKAGEKRRWEDYLDEYPELRNAEKAAASILFAAAGTNLTSFDPELPAKKSPRLATAALQTGFRGNWPVIEGYDILAELGHGGMGSVYKACQKSLKRIVALKVIRAAAQTDPRYLARFRTEAEATARLQHPHIAQIYEVGQYQGVPYLSMEYVDGSSLAERLMGKPQPGRRAAELVATLARTMEYAHAHGVVHRDLKPENILLSAKLDASSTSHHGVPVSPFVLGTSSAPKIIDFGLAKDLECNGGVSLSGAIVGTPSYMAPEQAAGKIHEVGPAADIYALGAILYEILTGNPPFKGATTLDTLELVRYADPVPPSRLVAKIPRDLETICLKAMAREPASRYACAGGLADDLERFLKGEPIWARPIGPAGRFLRWCRRNPTRAGLVATSIILLITVVVASVLVAAASSAQEKSQHRETLMQQLQLLRANDPVNGWSDEAWRLTTEAAGLRKDDGLRALAVINCAGLDARPGNQREWASVSSMAFDVTGRYLLLGGRNDGRDRPAEAARLWDLDAGSFEVKGQDGPGPVAFRADGEPVQLVVKKGCSIQLWSLRSGKILSKFCLDPTSDQSSRNLLCKDELGSPLLALTQAGRVAAAVSQQEHENGVTVWDAITGPILFRLSQDAVALSFNRAGNLLVTGNREGGITIWSVPDGKLLARFEAGRVPIHCLSFSPDDTRLAVGDCAGTVTVWDVQTHLPISYCRAARAEIHSLVFNPDGTLLATGGRGTVRLWDVSTGRSLLSLRTTGVVSTLAFAPSGRRLAVGTKSPGRVSVWDLETGRGIQTLHGLTTQASRLCFSADGRLLAALAPTWQVAIWDVSRGQLCFLLTAPRGNPEDAMLVFSPDASRLACSAGEDVKMWDVVTGQLLGAWRVPKGGKDALAFHPSGGLLLFRQEREEEADDPARTVWPRVCRIRNLHGASPLNAVATIADFNRLLLSAIPTQDGRMFIAEGIHQGPNGQQRTIKAYDALTGAERWSISSTRTELSPTIVLDPAGRLLALRTDNREDEGVQVEVESGRVLGALKPFPVSMGVDAGVMIQLGSRDQGAERRGYALFQRGDSSPRVFLGIETSTSFCPLFSRDGESLSWSNVDGSVSVCNLQQVRQRLAQVGLEW
jgi:serine/threonine protein kinase/WD40 repeat protein